MFFIVLCCYRPDLAYLRAQLDSIAAQTDGDFRCLVQDDASPPDVSEQLAAACAFDDRFSFSRNLARLGVFHNFEHGLYKTPADAKYICYCDQDDLWLPQKLARQRAVFSDPAVSLCHTDLEVMDADGQTLHASCFAFENRNITDYSLPQLILRNSVTGCTLAFVASLLPRLLPFPYQGQSPRFHHDHWTVLTATPVGRIVAINEPLVRYRQHGGNVLGAAANNKRWPSEFAHLRALLKAPRRHLAACEPEWTRRGEFIAELLDRAPPNPNPEARLEVLRDWTQRKSGSAYLIKYVLPHLFRPADPLSQVAFPVVLGKLYNGVQRAFASLVHAPVAEHRVPQLSKPESQPSCYGYRELKPLTESVAGRKVCLFAHYDRDGIVDDYVVYHLACLARAGVCNILITTSAALSPAEVNKVSPYCAAVIQRDNMGLDFGSWRTGLLVYPELWDCDTLLFVNDSVYGPMHDLGAMLKKMAATGCDFWGITESREVKSHYQSYFLGFHRTCLRSPGFVDYCNRIALLTDKDQIIHNYEIGMKTALSACGLHGDTVVPAGIKQKGKDNPTIHLWRQVLAAGGPFLKIQLLRENPHRQAIQDWPEVVRSYGYDPGLIQRHLRRVAVR